jgi:UDP-N-acetylmuramoyl-tripeptide--D-alanyl-D-alanine ligase
LSGPGLSSDGLKIKLGLSGRHNALNAAAAAATALALGCDWGEIKRGLELTVPVPGRLSVRKGQNGLYVVDDSYNANPTSVGAALEFLKGLKAKVGRGAILGDMLELGPGRGAQHFQIGLEAAGAGLSWLALVGAEATEMARGAIEGGLAKDRVALFDTAVGAAHWVKKIASSGSVTLVKGSRSVGLELAVAELLGDRE